MPENKPMQLRRRIAPSVPLRLNVMDDGGDELQRTFNLSLDFNAACFVQSAIGKSLLDGQTWEDTSPITISTMLYAAILAKHPEFDTRDDKGQPTSEGIQVIRSLMDAGNAKQIQNALFDAFVATLPPERQVAIKKAREDAAAEAAKKAAAAAGGVPNAEPAAVESASTIPTPAAAISAS
jgi:hypothetical protein